MDSLPLLLLVVIVLGYSGGNGRLLRYGEQVSNHNETAFLEQICPKPNSRDRKYVRIKTFNNKYVWAYPTHKGDTSYLRTRCCGAKDAVGRKDITIPGTKTTFIVHCLRANNENVFRFEILSSSKNPSGYYFDADPVYSQYGVYANKLTRVSAKDRYRFNFIVSRKRGPVIGIRTQGKAGERYESMRSNWLKFHDGGRGSVTGYKNLYTGNFPSMEDTFTLEAVPSGCVTPGEYVLQMSVMAAPWHTSQEDCESKPDRCFWSDGWDTRRRNMMTAICYYSKDSVCYQYRGAKIKYLRLSAKQCEAENHCYNYKNDKCYDVL